MPGGDRTGPMGLGPRTGRGAGYCAGYAGPGYMSTGPGRAFGAYGMGWSGYGRGRGGGRMWRNRYYAAGVPVGQRAYYAQPYPYAPEATAEEEKEMLRGEAEALKRELGDIQDRISVLERSQDQEENK
jgi:hypothetical protein